MNNAKSITSFKVAGVDGVIDEGAKNISVTVPYGTVLANLIPTVTHSGASCSPTTAQDFTNSATNPVKYTVTAEDDTSQDYDVTVKWRPGITATITNALIPALTFTPSSLTVDGSGNVSIALSNGQGADWYVNASRAGTSVVHNGSGSSFTFAAPVTPGFYNVTVIATTGGVDYAGNFPMIVE